MIITPIRATIGYNDLKKLFLLKASRKEDNGGGGVKPWVQVKEEELSLTQIIVALLQIWASAGSSVNATIGDLTALAAELTAMDGSFTEDVVTVPAGTPAFPGADADAGSYVGTLDDWGATV